MASDNIIDEPKIDRNYTILFENDLFIVVEKSGNCPTHEGGLYINNCLTKILEHDLKHRFYPVYRLDRETSGIVIFSKTGADVKKIFDSITYKEYLAICKGIVEAQLIDEPIGECAGDNIRWKKCVIKDGSGKESRTYIEPIMLLNDISLVKIMPLSGRQHQIRVHMQHIGHPILNDKIYGESDKLFKEYIDGKKINTRQMLHLHKVKIGEDEIISEIPSDMGNILGF